jgi:hypothetical protein
MTNEALMDEYNEVFGERIEISWSVIDSIFITVI